MRDRAAQVAEFLQQAGWSSAARQPLACDASPRRYERLSGERGRAVLMDAPPVPGGDSAEAFALIAAHLRGLGLSAPEVLAADLPRGLMLLEDLGDDLFARVLAASPRHEVELYARAVEVLAWLQRAPPPPGLPDPSAQDWAEAAALVFDSYAPSAEPVAAQAATSALAAALARHADGPRVLILRDFHAENLLWLPARPGLAAVGLLDFQLAQSGQPGYDLVSLVQDARRDVAAETEAAMLRHFAERSGRPLAGLIAAHAVLGAQRALRILGVFARLALRDGKTHYLELMPRVWRQLQENLSRPVCAELSRQLAPILPAPTATFLNRIRDRCRPMP